jgi:hypothetical protein
LYRTSAVESQQQQQHTSSTRSTLSATAPEYKGKVLPKSDLLPPLPEDERDILLFDSSDEDDRTEVEQCLTQEIGYSIKLLISKTISSKYKNLQKYFLTSIFASFFVSFLSLVFLLKSNQFIIIVQQKI